MTKAKTIIRAVLFDLDGTLIDSEPVYFESEKKFFAGYGINYSEELNHNYIGRGAMAMLEEFETMFPDSPLTQIDMPEKLGLKDQAYLELAHKKVKVFPAVLAFAKTLKDKGITIGIASGSSLKVITAMAESLGFLSLFSVIISAEEVKEGKPAPDVFLEAARRMGIEPTNCLVLEDSRNGLLAAKAAGMHSVLLPDPELPEHPDWKLADILIKGGSKDFNPDVVLEAFKWADS